MSHFNKQLLPILFLISISTIASAQYQTDSIRLNHNQDLTYHSRKIDLEMANHLMTPYPDAKFEMRKAITNRFWSRFMLFSSAAMLLIPLQEAVSGDPIHWESFVISVGFAAFSLPFHYGKEKHLKKSIDLYNAEIEK
jgi:hypothetical protein